MFGRNNTKIEKLETQVQLFKAVQRKARREISDLENILATRDDELDSLRAKNKALRANVETKDEQARTAVQLETERILLEAEQSAVGSVEKRIKQLTATAEESEKRGYKNGYSDGVADGLRKVHEITAEDRKQLAQIAMMAAASHSAEAVQMLAAKSTKEIDDGSAKSK